MLFGHRPLIFARRRTLSRNWSTDSGYLCILVHGLIDMPRCVDILLCVFLMQVFMSHYLYVLPIKGWDGAFGKPGLKNVSGVEHQEIYASLVAVWKQGSKSFFCGNLCFFDVRQL